MNINIYDILDYQKKIENNITKDKFRGYELYILKHLHFNKQLGKLTELLEENTGYLKNEQKNLITNLEREYFKGLYYLLSIAIELNFKPDVVSLTSGSNIEQLFLLYNYSNQFNQGNYNYPDYNFLFYHYLGLGTMILFENEENEILDNYLNYNLEERK